MQVQVPLLVHDHAGPGRQAVGVVGAAPHLPLPTGPLQGGGGGEGGGEGGQGGDQGGGAGEGGEGKAGLRGEGGGEEAPALGQETEHLQVGNVLQIRKYWVPVKGNITLAS